MSRLLSVKIPLHQLSESDLMDRIRQIREDRKIKKHSSPAMRPRAQASRAQKVKANLGKLSPQEIERLMKEFG